MNCKPGDLAVIVRATYAENLGRIVHVVEPWPFRGYPIGYTMHFRGRKWRIACDADWVIEPVGRPLIGAHAGHSWSAAPDFCLRPIRDQDGEDEILRLVGKPEGVTA